MAKELTSRIQKGGALLTDMRQLVCHWAEKPATMPPARYVSEILQKSTRARAADTYQRAFLPRFIDGCPANAWQLCAEIESRLSSIEVAQPFYYWITARAEPILYQFVTKELYSNLHSNFGLITVSDTVRWIRSTLKREEKAWSDTVTVKVARGMLAALRDFGVLEGATKKRLGSIHLPVETFCLITFCHRFILGDRGDLSSNSDWKLFLLSPDSVVRLFLEAHQHGWLNYQAAGGISRIEFPSQDFHAYCRYIFAR